MHGCSDGHDCQPHTASWPSGPSALIVGEGFDAPGVAAPLVDHGRCAVGGQDRGCRACVETCPFGAIDLRRRPGTVEIHIDADQCRRCGACSAVCPTTAIERFVDPPAELLARVSTAAANSPARLVVGSTATIERTVLRADDEVIALTSSLVLDETHLVMALLGGAGRVTVLGDGLAAPGATRLAEVVGSARSLTGSDLIELRHLDEFDDAKSNDVGESSRIGPVLPPEVLAELATTEAKLDRLAMLLMHLDDAPAPTTGHRARGFGTVEVDEAGCLTCGACSTVCPTDALQLDPAVGTLTARDAGCIGCSACVAACPTSVVTLHDRIPVGRSALERRVLVSDTPVACTTCGGPVGTQRLLDHSRQVVRDAGLDPDDPVLQIGVCAECRSTAARDDVAARRGGPAAGATSGGPQCLPDRTTSGGGVDGAFLGDVLPPGVLPVGVPLIDRRHFLIGAGTAAGAAIAAPLIGSSPAAAASRDKIAPGRMGMVIDLERCIGCHACTAICKAENNVPLGVYRDWVEEHVIGEYPDARPVFLPKLCNHCDSPGCLRACPTGAIHKRPDGIVDLNADICIACQACMQGCPYGMTFYNSARGTADKCNLCAHRIDEGFNPACVDVCPSGCRIVGDFDDADSPVSVYLRDRQATALRTELGLGPNIQYVGLPGHLNR